MPAAKRRPTAPGGGGPIDAGAPEGWQPVGPSPVPYDEGHPEPAELGAEEIQEVIAQFADAARRALEAGFRVAEIRGAHGYLIGQFLSPHSNRRTDAYGGSFENRTPSPRRSWTRYGRCGPRSCRSSSVSPPPTG